MLLRAVSLTVYQTARKPTPEKITFRGKCRRLRFPKVLLPPPTIRPMTLRIASKVAEHGANLAEPRLNLPGRNPNLADHAKQCRRSQPNLGRRLPTSWSKGNRATATWLTQRSNAVIVPPPGLPEFIRCQPKPGRNRLSAVRTRF